MNEMRVTTLMIGVLIGTPALGQLCDPDPQQKLLASDGEAGDRAGRAVAIDSGTLVVGATLDDNEHGSNAGSAYVFVLGDDGWVEEAKLIASDGDTNDWFGVSVAISGETVVVGARSNDNANGSGAGSAFVFVRDGDRWSQQAKLIALGGNANASFGTSVAIDGDSVVVGATNADINGLGSGAAYVFVRSGTTWAQQAVLLPDDGSVADSFATRVALDGDVAVASAPFDFVDGISNAGSVYVFTRDATVWSQEQKLVAGEMHHDMYLGSGLTLQSGSIMAGAPFHDNDNGLNAGAVFLFTLEAGAWVESGMLLAAEPSGTGFGRDVFLDGRLAIVGEGNGATLFEEVDGSWDQLATLAAPALGDGFGFSVASSGNTSLVGAPDDDENGAQAGAVHVYDVTCDGSCPADVNGDGEVGVTDLTFVILAWGQMGGAADVNGDGIVGVLDLVEVITSWGPCP